MKNAQTYFSCAREREAIRIRRAAGEDPPWTTDGVFQQWRFCNVHREDDRTTAWFREHVRSQLTGLAVVEATVIFRWFNRIETGQALLDLLLSGWDRTEALRRIQALAGPATTGAYTVNYKNNYSIFTGAYMIKSPNGKTKAEGILWCIDQARAKLPAMAARWGGSLQDAWADLQVLPFMGKFMAYEVVSDLRWTPVLASATDVRSWCSAGPGCARGLGRVVTGDQETYNYGSERDQATMLGVMQELLAMSEDRSIWPHQENPWEMREVEHWACEFDKFVRAHDGHKLKRRFV